jgi:hypothetical protein
MKRKQIFRMSLAILQPSQLFISRKKLTALQSAIDFSAPENIPPIPVKMLDGEVVMTDGHTRAFAAFLAGLQRAPVYWDRDALDWGAYRICVAWCHREGIHSPSDLEGRVVSEGAYERLWLDRCAAMQDALAEKRRDGDVDDAS